MKTPTKVGLIVIALALLASLVALVSRPSDPEPLPDHPDGSGGPAFVVHVQKPRAARPLFGILPTSFEEKALGASSEPQFDHTSRGAEVGSVGHDRLELRADGWDLLIVTDADGRVAPETRLVFPIELAERQVTLRCRPVEGASGYLRTAAREGSDALDGDFLLELAECENAVSGKAIEWPPGALTVRGSFKSLPNGRR